MEQADAPKSDWIVLQNRISGEWLLYVEALLTDADGNGSERQLEAFRKSETEFKASGNDFGRMLACRRIAAILAHNRKVDEADIYCEECLKLSHKSYPFIHAQCLVAKGSTERYKLRYESAVLLFDSAIVEFQSIENDLGVAQGLFSKGMAFHYQAKLDTALLFYKEAAELFVALNDTTFLLKAYNNMGIIAASIKDYPKARAYQKQSIVYLDQTKETDFLANFYTSLGNLQLDVQHWYSSGYNFEKALKVYEHIGHEQGMLWSHNNVANAAYYGGDFALAHEHFKLGLSKAIALKDSSEMSRLYSNMGWSKISMGQVAESKEFFDRGLEIAISTGSNDLLTQAYTGLADYYIEIGDYKLALENFTKSRDAQDRMLNEKRLEQLNALQTKFDMVEKEKSIAMLGQKNAQSELAITQHRSWIIGLVLGFFILASFSAFIYVQRKRKHDSETASKELEFRKKLIDATIIAEEQERQRIAKDLHDGLVQSLAAIKIGLQLFMRKSKLEESAEKELTEKVAMVDEAAVEARNISHQMMPRALTETGLVSALDDMLNKTIGQSEMKYTFEHFGIGEGRFKPSIEIGVYRIAQELVNNILKHSKAESCTIQLYKTKSHLILHVEDDGQGFKLEDKQKQSGIGLSNIFSRASAVNGEVNYEGGQPHGTIANVRVPIDNLG